ncbi:oxygenase MpaB family protein [Desertihabitans brevis]|uniref:oxygenase MpaB family protein n=1 Tax=Desertihabitans brevis TaxID=2268447 RepID=UPI0018F28474|nr:oxygenase MpaB family protein [Desertihabitans brevis]
MSLPGPAVEQLRGVLGRALRSRVAGPDARQHAERIWDTPGERWFSAADPIWRVHSEAAMFPGGLAALLLQSLHPLAMAAVAGHSGYRGDPWGRLQRTSHYLATTTFGTVPDAERAIAKVRGVHRRVHGTDEHGRPYRADDPHLLEWVHCAEVHSFLTAHQAYARTPLTAAEADTYVAQTGTPARLLGVPEPPTSTGELAERLERFRPELELSRAAREAAVFLLVQPPLPWPARPGYGALAAGGLAVLPEWARRMLLPVGALLPPLTAGPLTSTGRRLGRLSTAAVRWAMAAA